jgi:hypothetical protein
VEEDISRQNTKHSPKEGTNGRGFTFDLWAVGKLYMPPATPAFRALVSRSTQCSFSSVFHLRHAGMESHQMQLVQKVFSGMIIIPLLAVPAIVVTKYLCEFCE